MTLVDEPERETPEPVPPAGDLAPGTGTDGPEPDGPEPDGPGAEEELEERRYPSTIGGAFYLVVMVVVLGALVVAALGHWRFGVQVIAGALLAMAGARLVLPQRDAGMLAVRHRLADAILLAVTSGVLFFLTATIPNQPG